MMRRRKGPSLQQHQRSARRYCHPKLALQSLSCCRVLSCPGLGDDELLMHWSLISGFWGLQEEPVAEEEEDEDEEEEEEEAVKVNHCAQLPAGALASSLQLSCAQECSPVSNGV